MTYSIINRRVAIKQMGLMTMGAMLLPACARNAREVTVALKNIHITGDQEAWLAEVVGTIIPTTDTPGAKDLNVHQFVLRMVDDCYGPEEQQKFVAGLAQVDESAHKMFNKSIEECTAEERNKLVGSWGTKGDKAPEPLAEGKPNQLPAFYDIAKRHTIQGYLSSEYTMTNLLPFEQVPGGFKGCIEITDPNDIKTVIG